MRINLVAARSKGERPTATREATVEKDGANVFLSFPELSGVVSGDSAIALGEAILEMAGLEATSSDSIPAGWNLASHDGGYVVTDHSGVLRGTFRPTSSFVSV